MFGFEYFSGANVVIEVKGISALECAGLSFAINESKRPIYGYSSRFFDAVARGQVLVQGSLLINYVHEDYLREILQTSLRPRAAESEWSIQNRAADIARSNQATDDFGRPTSNTQLLVDIAKNWETEFEVAQALKSLYWDKRAPAREPWNPHDIYGGFNIRATFGQRSGVNNTGRTGFSLQDVYIVGRGKQIQISEDVIVEEYPFFARNSQAIYPEFQIVTERDGSDLRQSVVTPENSAGSEPLTYAYDPYTDISSSDFAA